MQGIVVLKSASVPSVDGMQDMHENKNITHVEEEGARDARPERFFGTAATGTAPWVDRFIRQRAGTNNGAGRPRVHHSCRHPLLAQNTR